MTWLEEDKHGTIAQDRFGNSDQNWSAYIIIMIKNGFILRKFTFVGRGGSNNKETRSEQLNFPSEEISSSQNINEVASLKAVLKSEEKKAIKCMEFLMIINLL